MTQLLQDKVQLAAGVLLRPFDTSARPPTYIAETPSGQQYQVSEGLYQLLRCLTSPKTIPELVDELHIQHGHRADAYELQEILTGGVAPSVLLAWAEEVGTLNMPASVAKMAHLSDQLSPTRLPIHVPSGLHWHRDLLSANLLNPFTTVLSKLYAKGISGTLLVLTVLAHIMAYHAVGLPTNLHLEQVLTFAVVGSLFLSSLMHEFGHFAACQRFECAHGALGIGLYFFNPVLYADVNDTSKLLQKQRICVDLGGFYFQLLCTIPLATLAYFTGDASFFIAIVMIDLSILVNFDPFIKMDGYWLFSDAVGIPNLHRRMLELLSDVGQRLKRRINRSAIPAPISSNQAFSGFSSNARSWLWLYTVASVIYWPVMFVLMLPFLVQAISDYPSLLTGVIDVFTHLTASFDLKGMLSLVIPFASVSLILVNVTLLVGRLAQRVLVWLMQGR